PGGGGGGGRAPAPLAVLFDEPFSALDQNLRQNLRREIKELQRRTGFTAVFVTHSREEAFALADRMLIMGTGRVEQIGRPEELYRRPVSAYVADFLGEMNRLPARVDPGAGRISLGGASLALPHDIQWPAGEGYLLLRPEDASLCEEPRPDALPVTVIARQFGGPTVRFLVEGDGWTASVLHLSNASPAVGPGEAAWLQPALRQGSFMAAGRNAEGISGDCRELPHRSPVG
ncbi:MAG: ABC transporter ATP-binding protein, partial [Bacteroidota bacterium]